jgi:CDP-diacylglycerol---glycerol-3-phosphate 3-phosphatidyltransferase
MATAAPRRPPVFNLPNQLTAARLVLAAVLFLLIDRQLWPWCVPVFALAAITDWLDGYTARKQGLTSTLGRVFDPLVDKVLICGAFIFLLPIEHSGLAPWMVTVVVARELIITGLRSFMETRNVVFGADWLGKLKMGLQCASLFGIFVALYVIKAAWIDATWSGGVVTFFGWVRDALVYAMLLATALSGLQYLWRAAAIAKADY